MITNVNTEKMTELVLLLQSIESSKWLPKNQSRYLTNGKFQELPATVRDLVSSGLMEEVLIKEGCEPNFKAHRALRSFGFNVFQGEADSYGWLTGCIQTTKGILVYG